MSPNAPALVTTSMLLGHFLAHPPNTPSLTLSTATSTVTCEGSRRKILTPQVGAPAFFNFRNSRRPRGIGCSAPHTTGKFCRSGGPRSWTCLYTSLPGPTRVGLDVLPRFNVSAADLLMQGSIANAAHSPLSFLRNSLRPGSQLHSPTQDEEILY